MFAEEKILVGCNENTGVFLLPKMANRHGVIAGATGTGKTVTLKVLAESFRKDSSSRNILSSFGICSERKAFL